MKRVDNIFHLICSRENLERADAIARIGKTRRGEIREFDKNRDQLLEDIRQMLLSGTYHTSSYKTKEVYDPKERTIACLPYYPDRIVHHAIMNILDPIFTKMFTADTYACIKERGAHLARKRIMRAMRRDTDGTKYCLKLDIRKYYPSIDHDVMKGIIRKKIKDVRTLALLDEVIDSADGLPIGNYISQTLANVYLSYFDHYVKEVLKVKYYYRYVDDIVILCDSKDQLRAWYHAIEMALAKLKLQVKPNWQIFPVDARGLDFLGFVFYHSHVRLRKRIKQRLFRALCHARKLTRDGKKIRLAVASYIGWLKYTDSIHLKHSLNTFAYAQVF